MAKTNNPETDLLAAADGINRFMETVLPAHAAQKLNDDIQNNFNQERNTDTGQKWDPRKEKKPRKGKKSKSVESLPRSKRRGLLVQDGTMRGSLDVEGERTGAQEITIQASSDVIYTPVHNQGLRAGRGKGFKMPQRQFAPIPGQPLPKAVEKEVEDLIDDEMDKLFG